MLASPFGYDGSRQTRHGGALSRSRSGSAHHDKRRRPWSCDETPVTVRVLQQSEECLQAYAAHPILVDEHANIERATAQGGYGRRQIYELVQNGADALLEDKRCPPEEAVIQVVLTDQALYCANGGEPIDAAGVDSIFSSHVSMKRGAEIGRFGLGFKSVLSVTKDPEFFSRSGSFRFDSRRAEERIREVVPSATRFPTLRLAEVLDPLKVARLDHTLTELWSGPPQSFACRAIRRVRLALRRSGHLPRRVSALLAARSRLIIEDRTERELNRQIDVTHAGKALILNEGAEAQQMVGVFRDLQPGGRGQEGRRGAVRPRRAADLLGRAA